ncbi:MAG: general secretion pathway protein GspK [Desulfobacterales bacterium]|nr:general secretion pathway protein GspK [Desulfobacterales bacterium]
MLPITKKFLCPKCTVGKEEHGFVLVSTLAIMAILSILAGAYSFQVRTEMKITAFNRASLKNEYAARAGIHRAAGIIASHWGEGANGLPSPWWNPNNLYKDVPYGDGTYSVFVPNNENHGIGQEEHGEIRFGLDDEESRLNINIATPEMLMQFDGVTSVLAEEILIFRVKKQNAQRSSPIGEKNMVNGPISDLKELLLVQGMTRQILFGLLENMDSPMANLTCYSSGKINVNTARPKVFKAIGFSDQEINTILQQRRLENTLFVSVPDFFSTLGLSAKKHKKIMNLLTVKSNNFRLNCRAQTAGLNRATTVLAKLSVTDEGMRFRRWTLIPQGVIQ